MTEHTQKALQAAAERLSARAFKLFTLLILKQCKGDSLTPAIAVLGQSFYPDGPENDDSQAKMDLLIAEINNAELPFCIQVHYKIVKNHLSSEGRALEQ